MRLRHSFSVIFPLLLLVSCIDQSDYQLDELRAAPTLALPLAFGDLTIQDFISDKDSANVKIYPDGLVYLAYEQELKSQGIRDFFAIPSNNISRSFIIPAATIPASPVDISLPNVSSFDQQIDLGISPEQLNEIALKAGQIKFSTSIIPASSQLDYEIKLALPEFTSRTTGATLSQSFKGSGTISIADYTMKLAQSNKFNMKLSLVAKKHSNPIVIAPGTSVNVTLNFTELDFSYIKGFFGTQSVSLTPETIEIGAFENAFANANVSLAQTKLTLTTINDNGVPCKVDFKKLEARKNGASLAVILNPTNPISIAYPTVMGTSASTIVSVVNAKALLDFAPSEFYYQADAKINDGVTFGNNFMTDTAKLRVKMNIEVPLYGSASNITLRDTIDVDFTDVDQSTIEAASLKLKLINELPLDGNVQLYLLDTKYELIGELFETAQTAIVKGSSVNASGDLQTAGVYDHSIDLTKTKLDNLLKAKHIVIVALMNTSKDSSGKYPDVKFKSNYTLKVEAGILASLKLNVEL